MVSYDYIFENINVKDNLHRDKGSLSKKTEEHKQKMSSIIDKIKEHPKKIGFLKEKDKFKILNKDNNVLNDKKEFIKRFLK